jgi:hypothetical protein
MTQRALIQHTLQSLQSRCLEVGECWIWQGGTDAQGRPQTRHNGKVLYVRRLARELADGKPMPRRLQAAAHCGDHLCVSPHCSYRATPQQRARAAAQRGAYSDAAKTRRSTRTVRARSHITEALVSDVNDTLQHLLDSAPQGVVDFGNCKTCGVSSRLDCGHGAAAAPQTQQPGAAEAHDPHIPIKELLRIYDEQKGDWCSIAREVERRTIAAARAAAQASPSEAEIIALLGDPTFSSIGAVREALRRWAAPAAVSAPSDVVKDAARYRWLREQGMLTEGSRHPQSWRCVALLADMGGEHADAAIDAAMLAAAPQVPAQEGGAA